MHLAYFLRLFIIKPLFEIPLAAKIDLFLILQIVF